MLNKQYPTFVKQGPGNINLWSPVVTNDWSKDMTQGHAYAREAVSYIRRTGNTTFLHHVVKCMVGHGAWGGVETAFFQLIAMELIGSEALAESHGYPEKAPAVSEAAT